MTTPTPAQVRVATQVLRREATVWDGQSATMRTLAAQASERALGRLEGGLFQLVVGPYNAVVQLVTDRCGEGVSAMAATAGALRAVAAVYDAEDARGEHRLRKLY